MREGQTQKSLNARISKNLLRKKPLRPKITFKSMSDFIIALAVLLSTLDATVRKLGFQTFWKKKMMSPKPEEEMFLVVVGVFVVVDVDDVLVKHPHKQNHKSKRVVFEIQLCKI